MKRQWYYRGSLKSCNYACSYCPFSKKKENSHMLQNDKEALFRFIERINGCSDARGAVQIIPYGEALVHAYYWEGLAALSKNPRLDAVGAQSNFSFPAEQMSAVYCAHGGVLEKLRLWGTFHPEMVSVEQFLGQCSRLTAAKISYCVGVVGVPAYLDVIRRLRQELPSSVYLWVNRMNGMGRKYTQSEIAAFLEIDEYFDMELAHHKADRSLCADNRFVEADGTMHRCNLCRQVIGNLYDFQQDLNEIPEHMHVCSRTECNCYLSYCNRKEERLLFFQPYPAFRIPVYPKAIFMDIDGTLIPQGERQIPEQYVRWLTQLSCHSALYIATSRPYEAARIITRPLWPVLSGGVFANGARCIVRGEGGMDEVQQMETVWLANVCEKALQYGYALHVYKKGRQIYKVTLIDKKGSQSKNACKEQLQERKRTLGIPESCQILQEKNCIQITKKGTGKLQGILQICKRMGYARQDAAVFGNSDNDIPMLKYFPFSVAAKGSSENVKGCAKYYFN